MSVERYDNLVLASLAGAVLLAMERYSVTSHGPNPWTAKALLNTLSRAPHMETARRAVNGRFNSVYRSPQINQAVGGVPTSRHQAGLATDIHPRDPFDAESAARKLWDMAERGELGRVHKVIWEPTWVHVSWRAVYEQPYRREFGRIPRGGKYQRLAKAEVAT